MTGRLLTLKEACAQLAGGHITPATLRAEAARGRLDMVRLGRRDFVTEEALDAMVTACHVAPKAPVSILTRRAANTRSATEAASSAQAALSQTLRGLKGSLRNTLGSNTGQRAAVRR
jgi:hypothetical protein